MIFNIYISIFLIIVISYWLLWICKYIFYQIIKYYNDIPKFDAYCSSSMDIITFKNMLINRNCIFRQILLESKTLIYYLYTIYSLIFRVTNIAYGISIKSTIYSLIENNILYGLLNYMKYV